MCMAQLHPVSLEQTLQRKSYKRKWGFGGTFKRRNEFQTWKTWGEVCSKVAVNGHTTTI